MTFEMYPTIVTPFHDGGSVDYESLDRLIDRFAEIGCDGVFAVCQSSEMFFLSEEEKLELAAFSIGACRRRGMKCVVSGHTQDALDEQIDYLKKLEALRPDAIILVSNRLAEQAEPDEKALDALRRILSALKPDSALGIYECPYPYKRPLSEKLLRAMLKDGRFRFIKDTCCRIGEIASRLELIKGSAVRLYNANMATLEESLQLGAYGYSGVMLNIMPEFFGLLKQTMRGDESYRAHKILEYLSYASTIECQNYPANAKYLLSRAGITQNALCRNGKPSLTESQIKELNAFEKVNLDVFFSLLKHAPYELVCGYDTFFRECHASSVLPLEGGRTLIAYFAGEREGADDVGIWLSVLNGNVFEAPRRIAKVSGEAHWNPVLYETDEGVRLVFRVGKTIPGWVSYTCVSKDGGVSWSEPEKYPAENPAGGPVRNKPLRLENGVFLAPNSDETSETWLPRIDVSKDGGRFFDRTVPIPLTFAGKSETGHLGAIQPTLWQGSDGTLHALLRTDTGLICRSDSHDAGQSWCTACPTALPNNNSGIDAVKYEGTVYLTLNPVAENRGPRTPLVVMRSNDDGEHFEVFRVLADERVDDVHGRPAQFSYPSIAARDGMLYVSFTHNRKSIALARIPV